MSLAIVTFCYSLTVILALGLLYLFGAVRWYWHAVSVAAAVTLGLIPARMYPVWPTPLFDLVFGSVIVFLLVWGVCAPFFRHHHLPVHHH